ncbi:MAG: pyridoxal phosphate-dependent aminotransferase [Candidatus Melainabacteria bacterium]|nr:pyridoxal phosphate-dependent aminotransferase [Candidatus Melainabacteria bacterium]
MFRGDFIMNGINLSLERPIISPTRAPNTVVVSGDRNYYEPDGIGQQLSRVNPKKSEAPANNIVRTGRPGLLPFLLARVRKQVEGLFTTSARISEDPIMKLVQQAAKDNNENKLVAIVGSAMDDSDGLIVPEAVVQAAKKIPLNMSYAPSAGLPGLARLMTEELLGTKNLENLKNASIYHSEVVTAGGTGAISTALQACTNPWDPVITPRGWPGYKSVASALGRDNLFKYKILDKDNNFNINSLKESLNSAVASAPEGSKITLVLNTPYDNPFGKEISHDDLMKIAGLLKSYKDYKFLVVLDTAYIDFGPKGHDDKRLSFINDFLEKAGPGVEAILASTLSKSFGMYGARVGAATLLTRNREDANKWPDVAGGVMRGTVSNLSQHGQQIAKIILSDEDLLKSIYKSQERTVNIINQRRDHFIDTILPEELEIIKPDGGFFLCLKVKDKVLEKSPDFAKQLSESLVSDHVYIPIIDEQFIRVPICGLSKDQLSLLANKIVEHTKKVACSETPISAFSSSS